MRILAIILIFCGWANAWCAVSAGLKRQTANSIAGLAAAAMCFFISWLVFTGGLVL